MSKGVIAALLILALGKPWCCCAFASPEPGDSTTPDKLQSCCHSGKKPLRARLIPRSGRANATVAIASSLPGSDP